MNRANLTLAALALVLGLSAAPARSQDDVPKPDVTFAITPDKVADVQITEESPGRFIATIQLVEAQKKALSELTAAHVDKSIEVTVTGEAVLRMVIRGPMDSVSLGPWMNEGLANLFAKCLKQCGPKKCL
jgi:hypothetical protein